MLAIIALASALHAPAPGVYTVNGRNVYVAVDGEPPEKPEVQFFDPSSRRFDTLPASTKLGPLRVAVHERRLTISNVQGVLGASLWYRDHAPRPTVVLIQGADDSTRYMGAIVPYFVANGVNVVSYDQRGTGISAGNWRYTSPWQKAQDIESIIEELRGDSHVDAAKVGVWAASNGGWVAPIVATHTHLAFMILKSAAAESIPDNIFYEIRQVLTEKRFTSSQIERAMAFERGVFAALAGDTPWNPSALADASAQPWFAYMRIPRGFTEPPSPPTLAVFKNAYLYDPRTTLRQVHTPTLALFGDLDRNVDAADSAERLRADFVAGGYRNLTIRTFPRADHVLEESRAGYLDDPALPVRLVRGYPEIMISWLIAQKNPRGATKRSGDFAIVGPLIRCGGEI
jgi:pimeloyl-ACP methyl ester carboxylesterase